MENLENAIAISPEYYYCYEYVSVVNEYLIQLFKEGDEFVMYTCRYGTSGGWDSSVWSKYEFYKETTPEEFEAYIEKLRKEEETFCEVKHINLCD